MPVCKVTNHTQDRLGELRKHFNLNTKLDTRNEVIESLIGIFEQVEEIRKRNNLKTIDEVFKGYETMQKEKVDPENEIRNNKLDEQFLKLSEIKEDILKTKEELSQKLKKLEDLETRLLPQHLKETNSKLDALQINLRTVNEKLTEQMKPQQESPFDPELFEIFKRFSNSLYKGDLNKFLAKLLCEYNEEFFKAKYKTLHDKYIGTE